MMALHRVILAGAVLIAGAMWTFGVVLSGDNRTLYLGGWIWAMTAAAAFALLFPYGGRR